MQLVLHVNGFQGNEISFHIKFKVHVKSEEWRARITNTILKYVHFIYIEYIHIKIRRKKKSTNKTKTSDRFSPFRVAYTIIGIRTLDTIRALRVYYKRRKIQAKKRTKRIPSEFWAAWFNCVAGYFSFIWTGSLLGSETWMLNVNVECASKEFLPLIGVSKANIFYFEVKRTFLDFGILCAFQFIVIKKKSILENYQTKKIILLCIIELIDISVSRRLVLHIEQVLPQKIGRVIHVYSFKF